VRHEYGARTDRGRLRSRNEDDLLVRPAAGLFAVADGMGGHVAGDVASRLATAVLCENVPDRGTGVAELERAFGRAFALANRTLLERGAADPDMAGLGTTLVALAFPEDSGAAVVAHVGDSRAYRLRDGELERLTRDHTWVQEQIDAGLLDAAQAPGHPYASLLTRALGADDDIAPDVRVVDVRPGDVFLLCSDGLCGTVSDGAIGEILAEPRAPDDIAGRLIDAANAGGGPDNITAVVIRVA
jgi:serine/threonine protein phosphatase PrpC